MFRVAAAGFYLFFVCESRQLAESDPSYFYFDGIDFFLPPNLTKLYDENKLARLYLQIVFYPSLIFKGKI
jgi:hypothetical protein